MSESLYSLLAIVVSRNILHCTMSHHRRAHRYIPIQFSMRSRQNINFQTVQCDNFGLMQSMLAISSRLSFAMNPKPIPQLRGARNACLFITMLSIVDGHFCVAHGFLGILAITSSFIRSVRLLLDNVPVSKLQCTYPMHRIQPAFRTLHLVAHLSLLHLPSRILQSLVREKSLFSCRNLPRYIRMYIFSVLRRFWGSGTLQRLCG